MKSKASLILGVLVLILSAVGISSVNAATTPAVNAPPAAASTPALPAAFLCSLNQSVEPGLATTDSLVPAPKFATTPPPCGSCSDFICQTRSVGTACGVDPVTHKDKHCYDLGSVCQPTGEIQCRCRLNIP